MFSPRSLRSSRHVGATLFLVTFLVLVLVSGAHAQEPLPADETAAFYDQDAPGSEVEGAAVPARVPFTGTREVAMGQFGGCLITHASDLYCWGAGTSGQNGDGTLVNRRMPVKVPFFSGNVIDVSRDLVHACAVRSDGTVWCWGDDTVGQLGNGADGSTAPLNSLTMPAGDRTVAVIYAQDASATFLPIVSGR